MDNEVLAPAVQSILASARERPTKDRRLEVSARSLSAALRRAEAAGRVPLIAEYKPTSPTTEGTSDQDPATVAQALVSGGASAISVLTEPDHFGGHSTHLTAVRSAVDVPVLRKDFILRAAQLDTVAADAVLLISSFLSDDELTTLVDAAHERGFEVLVEAHTRDELHRAVATDADMLGINNRDLTRLDVDLGTFESVAPAAPGDVPLLAESGITTPADVRRMRAAGADGLLVGSAIMDGDPLETTRSLVHAEETDD